MAVSLISVIGAIAAAFVVIAILTSIAVGIRSSTRQAVVCEHDCGHCPARRSCLHAKRET